MKRITLLATLLLATASFAQVDIPSPWKGPFGDLGRNLAWGVSGAGGMNNAFIINIPGPQLGACLFIHNLSAVGKPFTLRAFTTDDQQALGYYATPGAVWTPINVVSTNWYIAAPPPPGSYYVAPNSMVAFSVSPASGAKIAFLILGSPLDGTADIFYTFGSPSPCSAYIPSNAQIFTDAHSLVAGSLNVNWIGLAAGSLFPGAPQTWRACSFYLWHALTGAAGTLNVWIESVDSFTGVIDDRVSFVQAAATGGQAAQIDLRNPANPHAATVGTLAAGTLQPGIFSDSVRVNYTVVGAGCTYNTYLIGICH